MTSVTTLHRSNSRGSDFELAYASPVIQAKGHGSDGRKRRSQGSSDDEGKLTFDGLHDEDLRVGGPYLCSLPAESTLPCRHETLPEINQTLLIHVFRIAAQHGVRASEAAYVARRSLFNPESHPVPTILFITTHQKKNPSWMEATRAILAYLETQGINGISVEIADREAFTPRIMSPVFKTDAIFAKWNLVLRDILREVDLQDMRAIGCYRRGRSSEACSNPPTVLITVNTRSSKIWKPFREQIIDILERYGLNMVAVEFAKDEILRRGSATSKGIDRELLQGPAMIGQSIASHSDHESSGSLGGFIQLQFKGDWHEFALTCFHCVIPPDDTIRPEHSSAIAEWRRDGVPRSGDACRHEILKVDHPSSRAMTEQTELLVKGIREFKTGSLWKDCEQMNSEGTLGMMSERSQSRFQALQAKVDEQQRFIQEIKSFQEERKHRFGYVFAGSGFRTKSPTPSIHRNDNNLPTVVDWALVRFPPGRKGTNRLKDGEYIDEMMPSSRHIGDEETLFIQGYRSGRSSGRYNALATAYMADERYRSGKEVVTIEHSIVGESGDLFSQTGDSGSFVFTADWSMVGMVWGGHKDQQVTYFTHVDDLVADMKVLTGAEDVRISPPQA